MRMKGIVAASLVSVMTLAMFTVPGTASAAKAPPVAGGGLNCAAKVRLQPTALGQTIAALGAATKRAGRGRQVLVVEVRALVPAGTLFAVFVNGTTLAGTITMAVPVAAVLAVGRLDLDTVVGPLPLGVDPVCAVTSVLVTDVVGNIVVSGTF